jgi:ABC-type nickel/cobalt efflux system permease component RcnA
MIYAFILQAKATTLKQQIIYSFIWAITSFLVSIIVLFMAIEVFGMSF